MQNQDLPFDYFPMVIQFVVALGFIVTTMVATHYLGPKRKSKIKLESFECGIESKGNARIPFSIKYFLVAILFVLFDVEVVFMHPWDVNFNELGTTGLLEMFVFMLLLL
ncbi:MAG: NADH-quinone oxidoreductase subunit A, partial [Bacteroidota bacterium]